ncbi:enoyl-CoA hydratase domain-containing protein 3, mitochondrial-like [Rhopilema esculentum]|uniref:enoyl-CoA hydratase domain-containing protein 3, mitochondrial-like n=1 Tax=Rhopilema esculentum TaxID=499914 RepID=UPI0031DABF35
MISSNCARIGRKWTLPLKRLCRYLKYQYSSMPDQANLTKVSQNDGICNIVLHDSRKRNSLSAGMLDELKRNLYEASEDKNTKVIILSANGPVFSAGHNLKELLAEEGKEFHEQLFQRCSEVMCLVQDVEVPVIAQVRGLATAAGCQLVASCDLAVASENAKFATPGVSIGLFCSTPAVAIARALPRKVAMQMLLTAKPITAHDALNHGLVNKVVKDEDLEETTLEVARGIASFSRPVMALGKKCFYNQISKPRDEAYRIAESAMVHNLTFTDAQEGINAFLQKRKPNWTDS